MMRLRSKELSCPSRHDEIYGAYKTIIYMNEIIGRKKEISELKRLYASRTAEFVAIYGRRRVGKTFLVDEALSGKITFRHAGLSPVDEKGQANNLKKQLQHFYQSLQLQGMRKSHCPKNWLEAFFMLEMHLQPGFLSASDMTYCQ